MVRRGAGVRREVHRKNSVIPNECQIRDSCALAVYPPGSWGGCAIAEIWRRRSVPNGAKIRPVLDVLPVSRGDGAFFRAGGLSPGPA